MDENLKTVQNGDCIEVIGRYIEVHGYTKHTVNGLRDISYRHIYRQYHGPIPKGLCVRHTCDNPLCVNPKHLLLGTVMDNVSDRVKRNRSAVGTRNGRSVLNEAQVMEIRSIEGESCYRIAKRFNINETTVQDIRSRKIWKHL